MALYLVIQGAEPFHYPGMQKVRDLSKSGFY